MVSIVLPWPTYILLVIPRTDSEVIKNVLYRSSPLHLPPHYSYILQTSASVGKNHTVCIIPLLHAVTGVINLH